MTITIAEHNKLDDSLLAALDEACLRDAVNYDTSEFVSSKLNLMRYEWDPANQRTGFYTYFRIGAEWISREHGLALVVVPKVENIDFLEMFMLCLADNEPEDCFQDIYDIDFEAPPIQSRALNSVLSPLLVVQYVRMVRRLVTRGLRKGYVSCTEDLPKVKGRISVRRSERNALFGHRERMHCTFDEYSVDNAENRFLKRALLISQNMVARMHGHRSQAPLQAMLNRCLGEFEGVASDPSAKLPAVKSHKLFKEYNEALRLANMIIRHHDLAINHQSDSEMCWVPVFRIDMALLFEHYLLAMLRYTFGKQSVLYQTYGFHRRFIADFLISRPDFKAILDAKYVEGKDDEVASGQYVMQLSGYARDKVLLKKMGIGASDDDTVPIVPCVLVHMGVQTMPLNAETLFYNQVCETVNFYTFPLAMPTV